MTKKPFVPKTKMAELPAAETINPVELLSKYINGEIDLICILGPTASGKTKYAVGLARELNNLIKKRNESLDSTSLNGSVVNLSHCEIISADSRQVYRGMNIGTGKDLDEYGEIPYHLIDILDAGEKYNIFEYQRDFEKVYKDIRERNCLPILCGGSGLYIETVTCDYSLPEFSPNPSQKPLYLPKNTYYIGTLVSREERRARIDRRLDARLEEGMIDEIRSLLEFLSPEDLIYYGLEYKFVTQYIIGELTYEEMRAKLATAIHRFAKRQMTWFRGMERKGLKIHWTKV